MTSPAIISLTGQSVGGLQEFPASHRPGKSSLPVLFSGQSHPREKIFPGCHPDFLATRQMFPRTAGWLLPGAPPGPAGRQRRGTRWWCACFARWRKFPGRPRGLRQIVPAILQMPVARIRPVGALISGHGYQGLHVLSTMQMAACRELAKARRRAATRRNWGGRMRIVGMGLSDKLR